MASPSKGLVLLLLLFICGIVYSRTFFNDWTYDDRPIVVENPDARSISGFLQNTRPGRPLRELSYIPDHMLFGEKPAGYHIQQLGWHAIDGFLLFLLLSLLGIGFLPSLAGALLFLLHPLQVESVANIAHRKELLAMFFAIAGMLLYIRAMAAEGRKRISFLLAVAASYALLLLANETGVTLPLLFVVYEWLFIVKERRFLLKNKLVFILAASAGVGFAIYRYASYMSVDQLWDIYSKNAFIATKSFYPLYMGCLKALGFYVYKIILPMGLAPEYVVHFSEDWLQPWALLPLLILAGLVILFFVLRKRSPVVAFGIAWFLVLYLPVSNVIPVAYMIADRYMYMPLGGVAILAAALFARLPKKGLAAVIVAIIAVFGALSFIQSGYWRDEHTLWRHAVEVNPDSSWCQEAAAHSFMLRNEPEQALYHARKALEVNRYNTRAYLTLGKVEEMNGNLDLALKNYELFVSVGEIEFPEQVAEIQAYIPTLRERVRILNELRKG